MDINEIPDIYIDKGLKAFVLSCIDYVRYEGLIDSTFHDKATNAFLQLIRDNVSYEMFITNIKHNATCQLERRKIWL